MDNALWIRFLFYADWMNCSDSALDKYRDTFHRTLLKSLKIQVCCADIRECAFILDKIRDILVHFQILVLSAYEGHVYSLIEFFRFVANTRHGASIIMQRVHETDCERVFRPVLGNLRIILKLWLFAFQRGGFWRLCVFCE